jgi:hypothetical protein
MGAGIDPDNRSCQGPLRMKLDRLEKRVGALEARQPPAKSDTEKILEKCTVEELYQLETIAEKTESGEELTLEESAYLDGLEARYGPFQEPK